MVFLIHIIGESMKKIIVLLLACLVVQGACNAKDYAKLQIKEMKKSQEYSATNKYFADYSPEKKTTAFDIKDPKLIKLDGYEVIPNDIYKAKIAKDNVEYKKISNYLASKKVNEYYMQAYGEDFYHVYRIAEKIIRANNLNFVNWRLAIEADTEFNAYNSETNSVTISTGAYDTLKDNDDALALMLGHEFAHGLLGHQQRKMKYYAKMERAKRIGSYSMYHIARKRFMAISRDMEYAADVEGAKLAKKAGYDLSKAKETISFLNTLAYADELNSSHPSNEKRLKNFAENRKYFMEDEWEKQGRYNIYKSEVLPCEKSSHRSSIVINRGKLKSENDYYSPETAEQVYLRFGYKSYLNGDFNDAIKYFKDYLKVNKGNYAVYLYTSYAYEGLYRQNGSEKDLERAKEFAKYAKQLRPDDNYVKAQVLAL